MIDLAFSWFKSFYGRGGKMDYFDQADKMEAVIELIARETIEVLTMSSDDVKETEGVLQERKNRHDFIAAEKQFDSFQFTQVCVCFERDHNSTLYR